MKPLAAGNWLWLLRHEMTLAWRNIGGKRIWFLLIAGGVLWAFVHFAAWRVLRCNPWSNGGVDEVPTKGEPLFRTRQTSPVAT